jgi:hypothetical protein
MSERDMQSLIALLERQLGVQWSDVVEWLRSQNSVEILEAKLVSGRLDDVLADVKTAAEKFAADLNHAYLESGRRAAAWLDSKVPDTMIHFDTAAPEVIAAARRNTYEQVVGLTLEQRDTMRQVIVDGHMVGENPRETARRLRDGLGLAPPQQRNLDSYRRALESGDFAHATGFELRDARSDRTFRDREGKLRRDVSLTQAQVDSLTERYRVNAVNQRAETIARTESLRVAHEGSSDAIDQAIRRGDIDADQLVKEWHSGPRTKDARLDHQAMGRGDPIAVSADFVFPDGTRMKYPGDPRGGARHTANCRCASSMTFRAG